MLTPIAGSVRALAADQTTPSQIAIAPGRRRARRHGARDELDHDVGDRRERCPRRVVRLCLGRRGPVRFAFGHHDTFVVSDAAGDSGASSYRLEGAQVQTVSPLVPSMRRAACWTVVTENGRFAYVTNGGTGDVTGLRIDKDGAISLLSPGAVDVLYLLPGATAAP